MDTGAGPNVIAEKTVALCQLKVTPDPDQIHLSGVDDHNLVVLGIVTTHLKLANIKIPFTAYVIPGYQYEMLLGRKTMEAAEIKIDLSTLIISIGQCTYDIRKQNIDQQILVRNPVSLNPLAPTRFYYPSSHA